MIRFFNVVVFIFSLTVSTASFASDLSDRISAVCLQRQPAAASAGFCECLTKGAAYNDFLHDQQFGGMEQVISKRDVAREKILQAPTMNDARIKEICDVAVMQFKSAAETAGVDWSQRITQMSQKLKAEYPDSSASHMQIRSMMLSNGYCSFDVQIEKARAQAIKLGPVEQREYNERHIWKLYSDLVRSSQGTCQ